MSSASTISSTGLTSSSTLSNAGATGTLHITGLGNGIDYDTVIQAEMTEEEQPLTNTQNEITGLKTEDTSLSSLQSALQAVSLDAQLLSEPSTFFQVQSITSSNSTLVSAATTNGVGAPVGSVQVAVSQLAASAQSTFAYTPPATGGTDTLSLSDGVNTASIQVTGGTTTTQLASQINSDDTLPVYAAVDSNGNLVLSSRNTGEQYSVSASDTTTPGNLTTQSTTPGADCEYSITSGSTTTSGHYSTDTVPNAIPGVTLNLEGVTGSSPVTVTAQAPGANVSAITQMVQSFITDYNTAMSALNTAVNTQPTSASSPGTFDPNSGSLFGDSELESLMSSMRDSMITDGSGLSAGMAAMSDLGITTGASTGSATVSSVDGDLTVNTSTLATALQSDPNKVQSVITEWSQSFQSIVNDEAGPGGALAVRVSGNTSLASDLQTQYTQMQSNYTEREETMESEWSKLESTLSNLKSDGTYLTELYNEGSSSSSSSS